jgi:general secretion pathway protein H
MSHERDQGFTLLEMIVVLAIMGVVIGVVVTRGPQRSRGLETRAAAGVIAQALRSARAQAIERGTTVEVAIDPARHEMAADGGRVRALARDMAVAVLPPALPGPGATRIISFAPDGSASGGEILLGSGKRQLRISVQWLTGQVKVENAS